MLKPLTAALAVSAALAPACRAMELPKTADDCYIAALNLAEAAEERKLAAEKLARVEDLLTTMEGHCEASRFPEATAVSADIEGVIAGN
jgi:hypothetical protein